MQQDELMIYEKAFDVLAKEIAIGFYEWARTNKKHHKVKNTNELFEIFINQPLP